MPLDDYPTCADTFATLLVFTGDADPDAVTARLGIQPTGSARRGEVSTSDRGVRSLSSVNLWSLRSKGSVDSRDSRRHVDWLLDRAESAAEALRTLQKEGCRTEIACHWVSKHGHGGPIIPPSQMRRLADLDIELWFDFYGPFDDDPPS